jgi:tetratricopeptide (TPR) repeat protein
LQNLNARSPLFLGCLFLALAAMPNVASATDWEKTIRDMQRQGASRKQLAIAYNNYALSLDANRQWSLVERNMRKAMTLDPGNKRYRNNSATACLNRAYHLFTSRDTNDRKAAQQALVLAKRSLKDRPKTPDAYTLIGDIEYASQRLERARLAWEKAQQLSPSAGVAKRLSRLKSEAAVEQKLARAGNAYFDLRYQDEMSPKQADELLEALMDARKMVGREFRFWPDRRMVVLIYSKAGFAKVRRGPEWAVGVYDGKIRVQYPMPGFRSTLVHEYTHAIIHHLAGNHCPRWLNEGLAEFEESKLERPSLESLRVAFRADELISIHALDSALRDKDWHRAHLAYEQSYTLASYLADTYPFYRIKLVLEQLGAGASIEQAINSELHTSLSQIEEAWQAWLPDNIR